MKPHRDRLFFTLLFFASLPLVLLVVLPLAKMLTQPGWTELWESIRDPQVLGALARSMGTSLGAALICILFGTPLAYLLARKSFPGKRAVEGIVDLPIMIPHPVIGIAVLSLAGRHHPLGRALQEIGVQVMGTYTGIVTVLVFVGLPFYVNTVKAGFEAVPTRLEKASRSLGAGMAATFLRVTLPLTWTQIVLGTIMCTARAISEFGAVVIVAYHPMTAPVLIYERFTAYGLRYSQSVCFWLIAVSFLLFVSMRLVSRVRTVET
ncbi:MAG: ABC transporter permease [Deltaproteobacteria bacterium]|nr:ABC transporter permease [Deltaproteobacteria bacterium]